MTPWIKIIFYLAKFQQQPAVWKFGFWYVLFFQWDFELFGNVYSRDITKAIGPQSPFLLYLGEPINIFVWPPLTPKTSPEIHTGAIIYRLLKLVPRNEYCCVYCTYNREYFTNCLDLFPLLVRLVSVLSIWCLGVIILESQEHFFFVSIRL